MKAVVPIDEALRLAALERYKILDTKPEAEFDAITRLAAYICAAPVALISLVDGERQWFKSKIGLTVAQTPRALAFCAHAILAERDIFIVPDALRDERFVNNPLVTIAPKIRFYAGVPLIAPEGFSLGTLCVIDYVPRELEPEQIEALKVFSRQVMTHLELRRKLADLTIANNQYDRSAAALRQASTDNLMLAQAMAAVSEGVFITDPHRQDCPIVYANAAFCRMTRYQPTAVLGRNWRLLCGAATDPQEIAKIEQAIAQNTEVQATLLNYRADGRAFWCEMKIAPVFSDTGKSLYFVSILTDISDRVTAETALRESELTLRSFYDSTSMMMGIVELRENDILHISDNAATAKFFGTSQPAMQYWLASEIGVPQQHIQTWIERYREAERSQSPVKFVYSHQTSDGTRWLSATVSAIAKSQEQRRFAYTVEDITDRVAAEAELRWQETLLRSMADASPLAFYVVDNRSDRILYFNHRFCEIWGIESLEAQMQRGELKNQDIIPHCLPLLADVPGFAESCKPLQSEANRLVVEDEISFIDGRTIRRFSAQIRDEADRYFGRLYLFEDITERKQAAQKIREQAALLDVTTDAILVRDLDDDKILYWNRGAERVYGWKAAEALGGNAFQLLYNKPSLHAQALQTVRATGEWDGELEKVTKTGKEIVVESRWTLMRDERGQPKSILSVDTDITEKKQLTTQFLRAQRLESIGTLASGIAHDLNNVLAPILMSAQLLQLKTTDARNLQILQAIEINAKRGAALIKQVLSFARGVEGQHVTLQLRHLIAEIRQVIKETFPKSIALYSDVAPDLWAVVGDATQLHQVLMNLCVNARDAMPNGGTLKITAENFCVDEHYAEMYLEAKAGSYVAITVADTGLGMPSAVKERIFEPFFTTKEIGKGTGLGLSTVMGIVKGHRGFIQVTSEEGKGTQFQVYLPAVEVIEQPRSLEREIPTGNGELILVVDDEAPIREIIKTSLEAHDYRVLTATDGIDAIAVYVQHRAEISVVLVDMMMAAMDGVTTIRTLQKLNSEVKVIATSGLAANERSLAVMGNSVKAFLLKPYTAQELLRTIRQLLSE